MKDSELKIPKKELLMIYPDQRQKLFMDLVNRYPTVCKNLSIVYGYLNVGSMAEVGKSMKGKPLMEPTPYDYLLIFRIEAPESEAGFFYGIEIPLIYSTRSLPGYRYCIRENRLNEFFTEATEDMARIPYMRFVEFIEVMAELSMSPDSPKFWSRPENAKILMIKLAELTKLYVRRH